MCLGCSSVRAKVDSSTPVCCHCHWALPGGVLSLGRGAVGTGAHICPCSKLRAAFVGTREEAGSIGNWQHKLGPAGTRYSSFGPHLLVLL